jgi:hypothetical protein
MASEAESRLVRVKALGRVRVLVPDSEMILARVMDRRPTTNH